MRVSFDLSPRDLEYFRNRLREVRTGTGERDEGVCEFRATHPKGADEAKLSERRKSLQTRMRRRSHREVEVARERGGRKRSPFRLW